MPEIILSVARRIRPLKNSAFITQNKARQNKMRRGQKLDLFIGHTVLFVF